MRKTSSFRGVLLTLGLCAAGTLCQFGGCGFPELTSFLTSINPCGTILDCDPAQYTFATSGYSGPGVDLNVDMTCTFPPYCGTALVPADTEP